MDMFPEIFYLSVGFVLMAVAFYSVLAAIVFPFFIEDYKSKMGYVWVFSLLYLTVVLSHAFNNWVGFVVTFAGLAWALLIVPKIADFFQKFYDRGTREFVTHDPDDMII